MKTLIIGNGFDRDLGLEITYSNFLKSGFYPKEGKGLIEHIRNVYEKENWIDLEIEIKKYVTQEVPLISKSVKEEFDILVSSLKEYINDIYVNRSIDTESNAARLLRAIINIPDFKIFTFNYTDIQAIANQISDQECNKKLDIKYVHGSLDEGSIVVGVEDDPSIPSEYKFVRKSRQNCMPTHLSQTLNESDEVIIFGHSLGITDSGYFKDFFLKQSDSSKAKKMSIHIFTFDNKSVEQTIDEIDRMVNTKLSDFNNSNDYKIWRTHDEMDKDNIDKYYKYLRLLKQSLFIPPIQIISLKR